jgi:hypothetical protein
VKVLVRRAYPLSVKVESFIGMDEALAPGDTKLQIQGDTLLDLLLALNEKYSATLEAQLVNPHTERVVNYDVFINGRHFENRPHDSSNVKLGGGDEITVSLPEIWGG